MFDNIGSKIKMLAKVLCWVMVAVFVIYGLVMMFSVNFFGGLFMMAVGALSGWAGSFVLYGFGELVESVAVLREDVEQRRLQNGSAPAAEQPAVSRPAQNSANGYSLSRMAAQREQKRSNGWQCKKCGKLNSTTAMYCGDCGTSR